MEPETPKRNTEGLDLKELNLAEAIERLETELNHVASSITNVKVDSQSAVTKTQRTARKFRQYVIAGRYNEDISGSATATLNPDRIADSIATKNGWDDQLGEGLLRDTVIGVLGVIHGLQKMVGNKPLDVLSDRRRAASIVLTESNSEGALALDLSPIDLSIVPAGVEPESEVVPLPDETE